jgi:hypothetical protein
VQTGALLAVLSQTFAFAEQVSVGGNQAVENKGPSAVLLPALRLFEMLVAVCALAPLLLLVSLVSVVGLVIKR